MLNDSYGGICPNCGYDRMLVRYGSTGYYHFDACPNCGFNYGQWYDQDKKGRWILKEHKNNWEFWEDQFEFLDLKEKTLLSVLLYIETLSDNKGEIESVFDYEGFKW